MILPAILDTVLSDKASNALGKSSLSSEKFSENIDVEQLFEDLIVQLETLPDFEPAAIPVSDTGKLLPQILQDGEFLPPGIIQSRLMQSSENPGESMQYLAVLRRDLLQASISSSGVPSSGHNTEFAELKPELLKTVNDEIYRDTLKARSETLNLDRGHVSASVKDGIEQYKGEMDLQKLSQLFSLDDKQFRVTNTSNTVAVARDPILSINTIPMPTTVMPVRQDTTPMMMIPTQLFTPNWTDSFNSNILLMVKDQMQTAKLNLNPPELGPVEIRLSVQNDQTNIQFISQHGAVREVIEDAFPRLRELMSSQGINLGDVNVSEHSASERQAQQTDYDKAEGRDIELNSSPSENVIQMTSNNLVDHYI